MAKAKRNALSVENQIISLENAQNYQNQSQKVFVGGSWSDSDEDQEEKTNDGKCLMAKASNEVRILQKSQENGQNRTNTDTGTDRVYKSRGFDSKKGQKLDGRGRLVDVVGSGVESSRLSHESIWSDDLDLKLKSEVSTQEPIVAEVSTQEPIMAEVSTEAPIMEDVGTQEFSVEDVEDESAPTDGQFFYDNEGIDTAYETEYDVQSSEDASTDDDDDVDEYFLVDEENEIVEPDVDVHLFGISMDLPFDNISITNLVPNDVLEGEDMYVINADGFDNDPGNDEERNYKKRRLAELRTEMEGVINDSGQWKYSFYTSQKFTTPKEAKDRVYLHSIKSRRNLKLYKNDSVRIRARYEGKVHVFTMSQGTGPTGLNRGGGGGWLGNGCWASGIKRTNTRSKKRNNVVPLRSDTIRLVQNGCSFHGLWSEDPNQHLKDFLKLVDSLHLNVDNKERTRQRLFQFSLREQASNWLECLLAGSISTWEDLTTRFFAQFFPPGRTSKLQNDISMLQQHQGESFSEAWTHFKDLLQKVPHRGIDLWLQVQIFYDHVNPITRQTINQAAGDKGTESLKDKVSQEHVCEEEVPLNKNIRKQSGDLVEMPSEVVEQGMDDYVPNEIDGAKCEQLPNHVVKKGNLEFLVCK
ncbi:shikimate O-hydroxycinnamoyltransferase [Tanacetum coccineum]